MNASSVKRAALYGRISQAVDDFDKTSAQLARLRSVAAEAGYRVVGEYTDDDVSAYRGKYRRPGFDARDCCRFS
ncbi:recombinase family protein [Sphingomonas sp. LR61]|uniref:recombinase family protein n=1 Tax=Sphingomonas sp. LR61 TaxID=3050234 RepID=UPI003FA774FD